MNRNEEKIFDYILQGMMSIQKASELCDKLENSTYKKILNKYFTWIGSLTQELGLCIYFKEFIDNTQNNKPTDEKKRPSSTESFDDIIKKLMKDNNENKDKTSK